MKMDASRRPFFLLVQRFAQTHPKTSPPQNCAGDGRQAKQLDVAAGAA
jgi:hypothetical protein